ncbi:MAG: hypothetical protein ACRDK8_12225 [Solirubrobacteraceae bacterium]
MNVRTWTGSAVAVGAMLVVAGPAQAASRVGVKSAIVRQDRAVHHSAAYKRLKHTTRGSLTDPRKVIPEYRALGRVIDRAASAVSRSTATTSTQRRARRDWVTGVRLEARGLDQLATALGDIEHGKRYAARREARKAVVTVKRGARLTARGDRLLGLPRTD